jgi:hypothetical protein
MTCQRPQLGARVGADQIGPSPIKKEQPLNAINAGAKTTTPISAANGICSIKGAAKMIKMSTKCAAAILAMPVRLPTKFDVSW